MHSNKKVENSLDYRKKRIGRIKKIIFAVSILFLLIPTILCIILFMKVGKLEDELQDLSELLQTENSSEDYYSINEDKMSSAVIDSYDVDSMSKREEVSPTEEKPAFLTFDDGPSNNTDKILDILKEYHVKATFFVVGKEDEKSLALYQRIVKEGHAIGMHSYSHNYEDIYSSLDVFTADVTRIQNVIMDATGVKPMIYRFPGGSSNKVSKVDMNILAKYLISQGITYVDWNVTSGDADGNQSDADAIIDDIFKNIDFFNKPVILMHDAENKKGTIEALPQIITRLQENHYTLEAIDQSMDLVKHLNTQ